MSPTENSSENSEASQAQSTNSETTTPSESVETVRKVFVRDLKDNQQLQTVFRASKKQRHTTKSGKTHLAFVLTDKTGEVDGRIFDEVDRWDNAFAPGDYVLVRGKVIRYHGRPQVVVSQLDKLDPEPIDPAEFTPPAAPTSKAVDQIREIVERVSDPHVKALLLSFLDDPRIAKSLPIAPAAKVVHHAYRGGLADHLLSVLRLANRMADHYPMLDRDLLVAGALLHDIGKVSELTYEKDQFGYSDEGRLVGHLVMTAQKIHAKAATIPDFPRELEHHLTHIVLAHHGELEYGSPKVPMTLEAYVVHAIDMLDSRVHGWLEFMAQDPNEKWTEVSRHHDRQLWKGPSPTVRKRPPVETKRRRDREKDRSRRSASSETGASTPASAGQPAHPKRESARPPTAENKSGLPRDLTFKPFTALVGDSETQAADKTTPQES